MNWEIWGLPLAVLGGGLVVGAVLAQILRRPPQAAPSSNQEELQARYENLSDEIRELEADRNRLDADDYAQRREALIVQAAAALRDMDKDIPYKAAVPPSETDRNPVQQGMVLVVVLSFFAILGVLLTQNATTRGANETMTGGTSMGGGEDAEASAFMAALTAAREQRQAAAQSALSANPQDIDALNVLTYDALLYRDLDAAMRHMESAREIASDNPDVQIHLAILQSSVGMNDRALEALGAAENAGAEAAKLRLWRGFLYARSGRTDEALEDLAFAARNGQWQEEQMLASNLISEIQSTPSMPPMAAAQTSQPAAGGAVHLRGEVVLAEGVSMPEGHTLFISVRRSPSGGPPVAADRMVGVSLPLDVSLGDAQLLPMAGGAWPEEVWVQARLDTDGDAMTRDETDLESPMLGPITKGTEGVAFVLR